MRFRYLNQPVSYAEEINQWNVQNNMEYLYLVEGEKRTDPPHWHAFSGAAGWTRIRNGGASGGRRFTGLEHL